ncbi:hypothetical protein [Propionibacterium australiense]|uniref:Uncharacterized protein n=1 Tax=Propionibacterium australiense TaxID=119981 RepID=A0A383S3C5_9ACTN|nr:hypothetical protein [Propionibacterium australiense]RLP11707.1 hypothetical protein D9T14_03700 [Propionibacterium australiense]RLP12220.1 hypothetical protein D7U36_02885 [Propionibacterium australiense]SYZ32447.1 Hypothetical protein PROPAUS_0326 [Propionibacterium australiense]VEH90193.1 Uncharacterised protein [Propionibacterium australiense]
MTDERHGARQIVLVPVDEAQARRLGVEHQVLSGPLAVFVANQALCRTFELLPGGEEAELAALQVASVSALARTGRRLVLAAQLPVAMIGEAIDEAEVANGAASLARLAPDRVQAFFADDDRVDATVAAQSASGLGVDEAWGLTAVQELLAEPLLWHDISELADWLSR